MWGEKVTKFLPESFKIAQKLKNDIIHQPMLLPYLQKDKIIDFGIGDEFIAVLTSNSDSMMMAQEEKIYWNDMLKRVKSKLKMTGNAKT